MDIPQTLEEARAEMEKLHIARREASLAGDAQRVLEIRYEIGKLSAEIRRMEMQEVQGVSQSGL